MSANLFELASRNKYRFKTDKGLVSSEDLWGMTLPGLDTVARGLHKELTEDSVSFISDKPSDTHKQNQLEIVKAVIKFKLDEKAAREKRAANAERRQQILAQLALRDAQKLDTASEEQLRAELDALG